MDGKSTYEACEQKVKALEKEIAKGNQEKEALRKACGPLQELELQPVRFVGVWTL
jgi:hypothetical protein